MNIIVVDDERIILRAEESMIKSCINDADVNAFSHLDDAIAFSQDNKVDIAFLDINMEAGTGIELAKKLQTINPEINVIFCTGYSDYTMDALDLFCSAYLMKPLTEEKIITALKKLRYPVSIQIKDLKVTCFGNFDVTYKGNSIKFKYSKTKEMFAYLIDRNGTMLGIKDIMVAISEDDDKESYMRNIKADLINTFQLLGIDKVLTQEWGKIGIKKELISCDYYDYLEGDKELFHGEYMSQFSFAENTLGWLEQEK